MELTTMTYPKLKHSWMDLTKSKTVCLHCGKEKNKTKRTERCYGNLGFTYNRFARNY